MLNKIDEHTKTAIAAYSGPMKKYTAGHARGHRATKTKRLATTMKLLDAMITGVAIVVRQVKHHDPVTGQSVLSKEEFASVCCRRLSHDACLATTCEVGKRAATE
jgi:hypothetical protein